MARSFASLVFLVATLLVAVLPANIKLLDTVNSPAPIDSVVFVKTSPGVFYQFGGGLQNFSTQTPGTPGGVYQCYNGVHKATVSDNAISWESVTTTNTPSCRSFAAGAAVTDANNFTYVAVLGGNQFLSEGPPTERLDAFYALNISNNVWLNFSSITPNPGPRDGAVAAAQGSYFYVHGGIHSGAFQTLRDLWRFNINTQSWTLLSDGSGTPLRFSGVGGILGGYFLVSLGQSFTFSTGFVLEISTWIFNLETGVWSDITPSGSDNIPTSRSWSAYAVSDNRDQLMVHGGDSRTDSGHCSKLSGDTTTLEDLYIFSLPEGRWTRYEAKPGDAILPRSKHAAMTQDINKAYLCCGFRCVDDGFGDTKQEFNLDSFSIKNH